MRLISHNREVNIQRDLSPEKFYASYIIYNIGSGLQKCITIFSTKQYTNVISDWTMQNSIKDNKQLKYITRYTPYTLLHLLNKDTLYELEEHEVMEHIIKECI